MLTFRMIPYAMTKGNKSYLKSEQFRRSSSKRLVGCRCIEYLFCSQKIQIDYSKDLYQILGVAPEADAQTIKNRFYELAKQLHPDKAKGKEKEFKALNEAYSVLSNQILRKEYDLKRKRPDGQIPPNQYRPKGQLNYEPYSKISREKWAKYRQGWRKTEHTNHYNYYRNTIIEEVANDAKDHQKNHWKWAMSLITDKEIEEERQRMEMLKQKRKKEIEEYQMQKQQLIDARISSIRNSLDKTWLGSKIRVLFDWLISK